ncbi:hypothetical protein [Pseudomonas sp. IT-P176]|uniref:hypothetical protein n=1 Tax=Pseudomonas sp. IT-P176 TaxID=3026444 RepID=UPI0039E099C3
MQTETYIIIGGMLAGWTLTAFYFLKALKRAHINGISEGLVERNELHTQRVQVLNRDLSHLSRVRESELKQHTATLTKTKAQLTRLREQALTIKATPFTASDYRTLTEIAQVLQLAHDTWKAIPGCATTQAKAASLIKHAQDLACRTFNTVTAATALNSEPLTQLIESNPEQWALSPNAGSRS